MIELRPYQTQDLEIINHKFYKEGVTRQLVRQATGLGKTVLFCSLPKVLKDDKKIMVVVHTQELAQQAYHKMRSINPDLSVSIEMGQDKYQDTDVVIAGVATLGRDKSSRLAQFNPHEFKALVIDEAHHSVASTYKRIIDHFCQNKSLLLLGVTATPNRTDGVGLFRIYDEIVSDRDIRWGINNKYLSDLRGFIVKTSANLDNVGWSGDDFSLPQLASTMNTVENNKKFVDAYITHGEGRKFLAFGAGIEHSKAIADMFKTYGISKVEAIWGDDPDRAAKLKRHKSGEIMGLANDKLLTEGYDDEDIGCILICRPIGSESLYTQIIGRGTRLSKVYKDCIVIDCTGVSEKHSLLTLPNLFGLNKNIQLNGKSVTKVVEEIEQKIKANPKISLDEIEDPSTVESYIETVNLMAPNVPPEIIQLSKLKWRKASDNHYTLYLINDEYLSAYKNSMGNWSVTGNLVGETIDEKADDLSGAIAKGDSIVKAYGGTNYVALAKTEAKWHKDKPTEKQLKYAKMLKINVPPTATKGEVANMITATVKKTTSNILKK